jgi:ATP-dependent Clp protease, protease subunit
MTGKPMRVIDGTARPHEPFWNIRNAAEGGEAELEFNGMISEYSWFEDDITPKKFKEDLYRVGAGGPVMVRMNSGGGEVIAASVIKSILVEYPGKITVLIEGLAASAATIVAMAGDVIKMQESAYFMIHDPSGLAWGTIEDFKAMLDLLKTIKSGIVDAYETRTKIDPEKLAKMMSDETWLTAREAKEYGFIDEVIAGTRAKASLANAGILNCLNYVNVPAGLLPAEQDSEPVIDQQAADRLRAEVQILM